MTGQTKPAHAAPRAATPPEPAVAPTGVHVRMYRALERVPPESDDYQGLLGDCFLIRLERGNDKAHILIDCGMLLGSPKAVERMQAIAGDIAEACRGKLDLLVVTHEHWDHISGFSQAYDIFSSKLRIDKVWMAWTEKPDDPQAQALRKRFDKAGTTFAMVAGRLKDEASRFGADASSRALQGLEGFLGEVSGSAGAQSSAGAGLGAAAARAAPKPGRAAPRLAGRDILDKIKTWGATEYREPGEVLWTPGGVSVRAFVLGPPRDEKKLFKDKPSSGSAQETYFDHLSVDSECVYGFAERKDPDPASASPFAARYCRVHAKDLEGRLARAAAPGGPASDPIEWLCARYNGTEGMDDAARDGMERRKIDLDWLNAAGAMALKLDSDTNNTSLVLAFELPDDTVMLFAADAQVGNWLSWHDRDYPAGDGTRVSAEQLLNRTRFYKVGHHGSHNATLHEKGLAMMTRSDLVAAIPTDEVLGKAQGGSGWLMPNPRVNTALRESTAGRILRNDRVYTKEARAAPGSELAGVDPGFFDRLTEDELYLEYRLLP